MKYISYDDWMIQTQLATLDHPRNNELGQERARAAVYRARDLLHDVTLEGLLEIIADVYRQGVEDSQIPKVEEAEDERNELYRQAVYARAKSPAQI